MTWFARNAETIEACAAVVTAIVAVVAVVGVKYQLDATERQQQAQSARDTYRAHLAMAATLPRFAQPEDACQLMEGSNSGAYSAFVDHLLYSAEQMLEVEPGWETTFSQALEPHAQYLCLEGALDGSTPTLDAFLRNFTEKQCSQIPACE